MANNDKTRRRKRLTEKVQMGRPRLARDPLVNCTVQIPPKMVEDIDNLVSAAGYSSRSEAFREVWAETLIKAGYDPDW